MAPVATAPSSRSQSIEGGRRESSKPHQINTSVPFTLPSAMSSSTNGNPSTAATSPSAFASLQNSPELSHACPIPPGEASPTNFQLPDPLTAPPLPYLPHTSYKGAMSEAVEQNKSQGLIRRLSSRARKGLRSRTSLKDLSRDRSSGPIMVRRNASRAADDFETDLTDSAADLEIDDVAEVDELSLSHGLGITANGQPVDNTTSTLRLARTEGGIGPVVPDVLRQGTELIKVTKKKKRTLTFRLDTETAKVTWNDADPSKAFYIDDIQEIRLQAEAKISLETYQIPAEYESRCFTIRYADQQRSKGRQQKTVYLVAKTQIIFDLWTSTLEELSKHRHDLMAGLAASWQDDETLKMHWFCEMARLSPERPQTGEEFTLDRDGIESLCRSLSIYCSSNMIHAHFDKADKQKTGRLSYEEFKDFVRRLKDRKEIRDIFQRIAPKDSEGISREVFLSFLEEYQGVDVNARREYWERVFAKLVHKSGPDSPLLSDTSRPLMTYSAFTSFLSSSTNGLLKTKTTTDNKFDRPLNEYFISSSHNTYLPGRQVGGNSSVEPYVKALKDGCRCVEIDCWDGPEGRPHVTHGRTMSSSVLFSDCVATISKYAFASSEYPLIISLEVHCNAQQQQKMVDIMIKEFDGALLRQPLKPNSQILPSPEELKGKILIKVKAGADPTLDLDAALAREGIKVPQRHRSSSSPWIRPTGNDSFPPNGFSLSSPPSSSPSDNANFMAGRSSITATSISSATEDSDGEIRERPSTMPQHKSKIIASLGSLAVYTRGMKYKNFTAEESQHYNHVFSLDENKFANITKTPDQKALIEKHNMRYLMRVYPAFHRFNSGNPDPLNFWRRGAQMVALNWQTYDLPMQLNEAMFAAGRDKLGYVLKPKELGEAGSLEEELDEPSIHALGKIRKKVIKFSISIISGQQLPRPQGLKPNDTIDPYVEIELFSAEDKAKGIASGTGGHDASARHGMSGIGSPHRRRTRVVSANGFNPHFNEDIGLSLETKYPSLVFVRWTVWNSRDGQSYNSSSGSSGHGANGGPLATYTAKLSSLQQGYRHIPLFDHNGEQFLFATLFCRIRKEDWGTVEREDPVPESAGKGGRFKKFVLKRTRSGRNTTTAPTPSGSAAAGQKGGDAAWNTVTPASSRPMERRQTSTESINMNNSNGTRTIRPHNGESPVVLAGSWGTTATSPAPSPLTAATTTMAPPPRNRSSLESMQGTIRGSKTGSKDLGAGGMGIEDRGTAPPPSSLSSSLSSPSLMSSAAARRRSSGLPHIQGGFEL